MKPTYEVRLNSDNEEIIIQTNPDGTIWSFLSDPANPDYQRYLKRDEMEHLTENLLQAALSTPIVSSDE